MGRAFRPLPDPNDPGWSPRPTCFSCLRPHSHCVCNLVDPFEAHCNLVLLQHPNEWRKYYSTAKLVTQSVVNSRLLRGVIFPEHELTEVVQRPDTFLLYPRPDALDCSEVRLTKNSTVVVIDGTWHEAGKILFRNPMLKTLPCISFSNPIESSYRIRKQPRQGYLSTVESISYLLKFNADAFGLSADSSRYDGLLSAFTRMVEQQLKHVEAGCQRGTVRT